MENLSTSTVGRWFQEVILRCNDFSIRLEIFGLVPILHIEPYKKLTRDLLREYEKLLADLCVELNESGFDFLYVLMKDEKLIKFAQRLGFEEVAVSEELGCPILVIRTYK